MGTIALINPPHRLANRRKRRKSKKHRSAAQRAATARMLAANRARRGVNPRKRHANPTPRRVYAAARRRTTHHRRRRNPSLRASGVVAAIKPAVIGAGGAVLVQAAGNMIGGYLPAGLYAGWTRYLVNAGLALALGRYGRKPLGAAAVTMQNGALAITAYQVIRDVINGSVSEPSGTFGLSGMGYQYNAPVMAGRPHRALGEYMPSSDFNGVNASGGLSEYMPAF